MSHAYALIVPDDIGERTPLAGMEFFDKDDPVNRPLAVKRSYWLKTWHRSQAAEAMAAFTEVCTDYQEARLEWDPF